MSATEHALRIILAAVEDGTIPNRLLIDAGGRFRTIKEVATDALTADSAPLDMVLHCPACGLQHIDAAESAEAPWTNPPHRSHLCHGCGHVWRPADVPTNGVVAVKTRGTKDTQGPPKLPKLPQGYPLDQIPADYTGQVWLESQMRRALGVDRCSRCGVGPGAAKCPGKHTDCEYRP
jgi:hypothetical protein